METVSNDGKTTTYTYDENGRRKAINYDGGVSEQYTYDKDNQLKQLTSEKPNGAIISEYNYTYDLAGRQLSKTDSYGTTDYEYDNAGRITKVTTPGKTTVYSYDKAGNRLSLNETYTSPQPSEYIDEATGKDIQYILKKSITPTQIQTHYVYKYPENLANDGKLKTISHIYISILCGRNSFAIGKPDDTVLWSKGSIQYEQNYGLDIDGDGNITKEEATQKVIERRNTYKKK